MLATDFGHSVQHDVLSMVKDRLVIRMAWRAAIARAGQARGAGHEFPVHPADTTGAAVGVGTTVGLGLLIDLPVVRRALGRLCQAWPGPVTAQDPPA